MLTYCNGVWHPNYNFGNDLALGRAQGVQEFLEARGKILFHWDDHYARLVSSCSTRRSIVLNRLPSKEEIEKQSSRLLEKFGTITSLVRILVTPGDSHDTKTASGYPTLSLDIMTWPTLPEKALKLKTVQARREFPQSKFTAGYGYADIYEAEVRDQGFDKFLYWDERGGILEGAYENIFLITKEGLLVTPRNGVLLGITRKIVLELARASKLFDGKVTESPAMHLGAPTAFKEAFLTSTTLGVAEVVQIDDYDHFKTGPKTLTFKLKKLFIKHREKYFKERGA